MNPANSRIGRVFLVGAGPGDPGLITVRGAKKLAEADVVLYDALANPAFRALASPDSEWISVGKHGGDRIWKQSEIDDAIVQHARSGKTVVRLKGGDTGVFARTAEELDRLTREQIPFEVVPGITAALAAAAYTGIPITHRDWSSAVALVTGQLQPSDGGPEIDEIEDWNGLAQFPGTLVIYMGVTTAPQWTQRLIDGGMSPETPVALVRRCSWPDQETVYCQLDQVASRLTPSSKFRPPIVAIIGNVAHLGKAYDWFGRLPLRGSTVLVPRPVEQAQGTLERLEELGANVLVQSAIEIHPLDQFELLDAALRSLDEYRWIVFSSPLGVEHFFQRLHALGLDGRALATCRIAGVGPSIVQALAGWKIACDLVPDGQHNPWNAESLARQLLQELSSPPPLSPSSGRGVGGEGSPVANPKTLDLLHPPKTLIIRGMRGKSTIEETLQSSGWKVDSLVVYQSVDVEVLSSEQRSTIESANVDFVLVTSPSIASSLCRLLGSELIEATWVAISEDVAATIRSAGIQKVVVSQQSSTESMLQRLVELRSTPAENA